jgi:hypothetical protein
VSSSIVALTTDEDCDKAHHFDNRVRKTASFLEFSLCLSRACLGKMIVSIYKWLKIPFFAGHGLAKLWLQLHRPSLSDLSMQPCSGLGGGSKRGD